MNQARKIWAPRELKSFLSLALVVLLSDQLSKFWAVGALTNAFVKASSRVNAFLWMRHPVATSVKTVSENFFHFRYIENPGAAWGFLAGSASQFRTPFFLVLSCVAAVGILWARRQPTEDQSFVWGLPLIFGGAIGNFLDRSRLGYVIDFIDWHWFDAATWPTFNVANAAITIGVLLILPSQFRQQNKASRTIRLGEAG